MKRIIITGAALLAAIPASLGLIGNVSFAQSVPVRVPSQATPVGGQSKHIEIGDDKGGLSAHVEPGDDKGGLSAHVEPGDDKGGLSAHVEPAMTRRAHATQGRSMTAARWTPRAVRMTAPGTDEP